MSVDFVIQGVSVARSSAGELNETVRLLNSLSAGSLGVSAAAATHAAKLVHGGAESNFQHMRPYRPGSAPSSRRSLGASTSPSPAGGVFGGQQQQPQLPPSPQQHLQQEPESSFQHMRPYRPASAPTGRLLGSDGLASGWRHRSGAVYAGAAGGDVAQLRAEAERVVFLPTALFAAGGSPHNKGSTRPSSAGPHRGARPASALRTRPSSAASQRGSGQTGPSGQKVAGVVGEWAKALCGVSSCDGDAAASSAPSSAPADGGSMAARGESGGLASVQEQPLPPAETEPRWSKQSMQLGGVPVTQSSVSLGGIHARASPGKRPASASAGRVEWQPLQTSFVPPPSALQLRPSSAGAAPACAAVCGRACGGDMSPSGRSSQLRPGGAAGAAAYRGGASSLSSPSAPSFERFSVREMSRTKQLTDRAQTEAVLVTAPPVEAASPLALSPAAPLVAAEAAAAATTEVGATAPAPLPAAAAPAAALAAVPPWRLRVTLLDECSQAELRAAGCGRRRHPCSQAELHAPGPCRVHIEASAAAVAATAEAATAATAAAAAAATAAAVAAAAKGALLRRGLGFGRRRRQPSLLRRSALLRRQLLDGHFDGAHLDGAHDLGLTGGHGHANRVQRAGAQRKGYEAFAEGRGLVRLVEPPRALERVLHALGSRRRDNSGSDGGRRCSAHLGVAMPSRPEAHSPASTARVANGPTAVTPETGSLA